MRRLILTAALAVLAAPALAQDASAAAATPETAAAPAKSAEELAIEAQAKEFSDAMVRMQDELVNTTTPEEADAVTARYRPDADALADRMSAFLIAHANQPENEASRQELLAQATIAVQRVRELPAFIRSAIEQARAQAIARGQAAGAAAGETPAEPAEPAAPAASAEPAS